MTLHSQLATFLLWNPTKEGFYSALKQCQWFIFSSFFIFLNERCWLVLTDATKSKVHTTNMDSSAYVCLAAQLCPTFCSPMDCSLPGPSLHGDSPGKNPGVGCHSLLQGIFPTQGLNPGLPHCRRILHQLSHQGNSTILEWGSLSLLQGIFLTQELNQGLLYYRQILYQMSYLL